MPGTSTCKRIRNSISRFDRDIRANIAPIFAIALLPVLGFVGAAVDYTRANAARSSMQAAMDSAVLMVSRDAAANPAMTSQQITDAVQRYFNSLYNDKSAFNVSVSAAYTPSTSSAAAKILASGQGAIETDFMKIAGFPQLSFGTSSTSTWGNSRMRVALVLDNTGSMRDNGKMAALQRAAKDMIDSLSAFAKTADDVYISIIPFAKDVNVDKSNYNAAWINWTEWEAEPPILIEENYPINVRYNGLTYDKWEDIGPGAPCPFDTRNNGSPRPTQNSRVGKFSFACMDRPGSLSGATDLSSLYTNRYLIPSDPSGKYYGMICPGIDGGAKFPRKRDIYYNGCYTSVVDTDRSVVVSTGSGASCPSTTPNCSCTGSGRNRKCTQAKYKHYWRAHPTDTNQAKDAAPAHSTWTGCINDRDQAYDISNADPSSGSSGTPSTKFYAEQLNGCLPATITPVSSQSSTLKNQIDSMSPSGSTNQAIGLAWGWQTLSTTNGPFPAPAKDKAYVYQDYLVLLSDGLNTRNRWSGNGSDHSPEVDVRQALLCQKVKDSGTVIFTVQVNVGNRDPLSQVLQDCASNGNFQMITSANQTADAFQNILTQISQLRIAK
ncbi:hypothetical protein Nwi_1697 [Nitrobacter winogradskyi Nb-255]|uniref:Putative Flp pilus-assembly TadG-like N-terminal domain-containing protein n=1 Tax=Nitrobacter winogradskyi (strain ATCC 25391 / DSM 10237 / CIP 104748 / NCIMB 11846 / Nb-255) TaxID=323098 RepID=Q3SRY3_NITWN|nr:pilus assembly protein [Nitrobacter winogradskyi]ABA04958.1 hypothetical protein Nwi_1697 [Nitrobacter winogradskyi Nb-255]